MGASRLDTLRLCLHLMLVPSLSPPSDFSFLGLVTDLLSSGALTLHTPHRAESAQARGTHGLHTTLIHTK